MVTKCTTQYTLTNIHFAHTAYLCVPSLHTVSSTYCTVLLLTVHYVLCKQRTASTTDFNFRRTFTDQCLSLLVARLLIWRPEFHKKIIPPEICGVQNGTGKNKYSFGTRGSLVGTKVSVILFCWATIFVCNYVCRYIYICMYTNVLTYVCMYVYLYLCMYVRIYIYIDIYIYM